VHLAEAGHPLLGESRYRREQAQHRHWPFRRIALHAAELGFAHPTTGQPLQFHAKLPGEFRHFLQAMEREQQGAQRPPGRRKRRR
jgi:23S rRNA pseudouridine1911/1915/1917 synthase